MKRRLGIFTTKVKYTLMISFTLLLLLLFYNNWLENVIVSLNTCKHVKYLPEILPENHQSLKKMLFHTPFFAEYDYSFGFGQEPFEKYGCPVSNCLTTNNRNLLGIVLQLRTHQWIQSTSYVCTGLLFTPNQIFLTNILQRFVVHWITLLLVHFGQKSADNQSLIEDL